jgi:UDP-N-acetylglucosamine 2-epimerase
MCGLKAKGVLDAVQVVTQQHSLSMHSHRIVPDYEGGLVSQKVLRVVLSYTEFVNRVVWSR